MDKKNSDPPWSESLESASRWLLAMAHPLRLRISELLLIREYHLRELVIKCKAQQSLVLWHLKILAENGVIAKRKEGLKTFYWTEDKRLPALIQSLQGLQGKFPDSEKRGI